MHYVLWIDVAWDFIIAIAFFFMAGAIVAAVHTGKVGLVLGKVTFYCIAMAFICAGLFRTSNGLGLWYGDYHTLTWITKTITGVITLVACGIVNWRVYRVKHLPQKIEDAFTEFHAAMDELRNAHGEEGNAIRRVGESKYDVSLKRRLG